MQVIDGVVGIQLITKNEGDRVGTLVLEKDSISPWDILTAYERFRVLSGVPQDEYPTITYNSAIDELDVGGWDLDIRNNVSVACNIVANEKEDMSTEAALNQLHQVMLVANVTMPSMPVEPEPAFVMNLATGGGAVTITDTKIPGLPFGKFGSNAIDCTNAERDYFNVWAPDKSVPKRGQASVMAHVDSSGFFDPANAPTDTSISSGVSVQTIAPDIIVAPVIGNVPSKKSRDQKNKQPSTQTPNNQQRPQKQHRQQDNHYNRDDNRNHHRDDHQPRLPEPIRSAAPSANGVAALLARATNSSHFVPEDMTHYVNTNASCCQNQIAAKLDMGARCPFYYGALGTFSSIYAVWAHLKHEFPSDDIRELAGNRARMAIQEAPHRPIEGLQIILADATWIKVCATPQLLDFMLGNTLPYENMYYADAGGVQVVRHPVTNGWYMPVLEEIAQTVKRRHETGNYDLVPDFSFLTQSPYYDPTFDMDERELRAFLHERREERKVRRNDDYRSSAPAKRDARPRNPVIGEGYFTRR